jgi:hypothetical protein
LTIRWRRVVVWFAVILVAIPLMGIGVIVTLDLWERRQTRITLCRGNAVVLALYRYSHERGSFPASLSDLVPRYIDRIPVPRLGSGKWSYEPRDEGHEFTLLNLDDYASWHDAIYLYDSSAGDWALLDSK